MSRYSPIPPVAGKDPANYAFDEFMDLARALAESQEFLQLQELNVAPLKPRTGMVVLADGTNWDPGSGAGFYGYYGAAWVKLG